MFTWEIFEDNWQEKYAELIIFKKNTGHCNVPHLSKTNKKLGSWVLKQRRDFTLNRLSEERERLLNIIVFDFSPMKSRSLEMLVLLSEFKKDFGHCNVPDKRKNKSSKYYSLSVWLSNIRLSYRKNILDNEVISSLEKMGFIWNPRPGWDHFYKAMKSFYDKHGHLQVPKDYHLLPTLPSWLVQQRQDYKNNKLSSARTLLLQKLGVNLTPRWEKKTWEERFADLCAFKKKKGHCSPTQHSCDDLSLCSWAYKQRENMKDGSLSAEGLRLLTEIGFDWHPKKGPKRRPSD